MTGLDPNNVPATAEPAQSGQTVTVACKLPMGIYLRFFERVERMEPAPGGPKPESIFIEKGDRILINGPARMALETPGALAGGYALTPNVSKDAWEDWLRDNRTSDLVKNGVIFAESTPEGARARAIEQSKLKSGLEPLARDSAGQMIDTRQRRPASEAVSVAETAARNEG
jgi:hypothetical protein